MNSVNRRTGRFFAVVFLIGVAVIEFELLAVDRKPFAEAIVHPYALICLAMAAVMFVSSISTRLSWIQPAIFFAGFGLAIASGTSPELYSTGFYIIGILLLYRFGFFERYRVLKTTIALGLFYAAELAMGIINPKVLSHNIGSLFFITVLLLTLYFAFQEKLLVYLHEPKETLSLKGKGLTDAEQKYVLAMVGGKSPKEIAFFYEVSESTVRNTLARAYKKLGVGDRSELAALAARVELVA